MIAKLEGQLVYKVPTYAEILVGGVTLGVLIPVSTYDGLPECQAKVSLVTHLYVREDQLTLYGFLSAAERDMFQMLIRVSGIGPKVAIAVLSALELSLIEQAILEGDSRPFCSVPGVGKKTAERLLLELRDKLKKHLKGIVSPKGKDQTSSSLRSLAVQDAVAALVTLGYSGVDAHQAVMKAEKDLGSESSTQILVRAGLSRLTKS
jgi:Holliday junction DNA helicase RuvA